MTATLRRLPLLLAWLASPTAASAHRLDEYLQATLVAIEPGAIRLQVRLTPGVAVADRVLARIDRDGDGAISADEAAAYGESLRRDLAVDLDGRALELKLGATEFPTPAELRAGSGTVRVDFLASPGPLEAGAHGLALENRHWPAIGVYLLNAARPGSDTVQITRQRRVEDQHAGAIEFAIRPPSRPGSGRGGVSATVRSPGLMALGGLGLLLAGGAALMRKRKRS